MSTRLVALLLVLGPPARALADSAPRVTVAGEAVDLAAPEASAAELVRTFLDARLDFRLVAERITKSRREAGARVDEPRLLAWLDAASDADSPMREHLTGDEVVLRMPAEVDTTEALRWLGELKHERDRRPTNARLDPETGRVTPEQEGLTIDVWATIDNLDRALRDGSRDVEIVVHRTAARRTAAELEGVNASAIVGEFETPYDGSGSAADRTHNLRVAAEKIDGMVLMPAEVFDFNRVVGDRSLASGFRPAPVIAGGELVDGVGGGACQIAGTLHAAAFFAGLEIVERSPHSRPSSYIKLGLDAAVSYPNINFRFRNDLHFPVQIRVVVANGKVRAEVRGAERAGAVSFMRRVDTAIPFDERVENDPRLPAGVRVLAQRGVPGFEIRRWRIFHDRTRRAMRRQAFEDSYPPTTQVWRVGTGGPAPAGYSPPEGDTHGEYRADEFTILTQGAEGTELVRREGRYGVSGWTERAGMPDAE